MKKNKIVTAALIGLLSFSAVAQGPDEYIESSEACSTIITLGFARYQVNGKEVLEYRATHRDPARRAEDNQIVCERNIYSRGSNASNGVVEGANWTGANAPRNYIATFTTFPKEVGYTVTCRQTNYNTASAITSKTYVFIR